MTLVGEYSICNICGKRKLIATEKRKILEKQGRMDFYQECKDCNAIPLGIDIKSKKIID